MTRRHAIILLGAAAVTRVHAGTVAKSITFERGLMGTRFAITCHHPDQKQAEAAANAAFDAAERINQVASDYIADSELLGISKHPAGNPVAVSPLLFQLISEARNLAEKTTGHFDPTLGPLTKLWRESRRRSALPDARTLAAAHAACGWKHLILDPPKQTVTFMKPAMRLDLGGIAKGQAADAMLAVMKRHAIPRSCITAGGDVRMGDPPPDSNGWKIGVRTDEDAKALVLSNCAVSTSGDLHQFIEIGGTRYSHIIDPATGLGITRGRSATVIAATATVSDALATACCVAPGEIANAMAAAAGATEVYLSDSGLRKQ
ncbi:MAG: FAD:protein FMN transferase [Verrucomicrobiota bacterium]